MIRYIQTPDILMHIQSNSHARRVSFFVFLTKCLSKCLSYTTHTSSFCKTLHPKCLIMFWIHLCLDNCSVSCIVTLCYVLHQKYLESWHIHHTGFSGICQYYQAYSALLRHINTYEALLRHIQVYSGIFSTLCNPRIFTTLPNSESWDT